MNTKNNKNFKKKKIRQPLDKNQLLAYILAGLMIFWTVASVFGFIAYGRTKREKASNMVIASAMTVEQYEEGSFFIELALLDGFTYYTAETSSSTPLTMHQLSGHYILQVNTQGVSFIHEYQHNGENVINITPLQNAVDVNLPMREFNLYTQTSSPRYGVINCGWSELPPVNSTAYPQIDMSTGFFFMKEGSFHTLYVTSTIEFTPLRSERRYQVLFDITFILDTTSYHYGAFVPFYNDNIFGNSSYIQYTDIPCMGFPIDDYTMLYKEYEDYRAEHTGDYSRGFEQGYSRGKEYGFNLGKDKGFQEGVASANEYSFDGLLSAVFDVPVRTFTSLFNFDFLGVNLTTFFLSLLTLAGVLAVVRMLL